MPTVAGPDRSYLTPYRCPVCSHSFSEIASRDAHLQREHGDAIPVYHGTSCPCGRSVQYLDRDICTVQNGQRFVVCAGNHTIWLPNEKED